MRRVAIAGALAPFFASIVFHLIGPHAQAVTGQQVHRPALVFDQYLIDLGAIKPTKYAYATFAFANSGKETVRVKDLQPSCGCLSPRLEKREYQPGEQGQFLVRIMVPNEAPGPKEYTIGVAVFGRSEEYDPRLDSIVRVEARRLRTKLDEYYAGGGRHDPIVIEMPRGSYVPTFARRAPAA